MIRGCFSLFLFGLLLAGPQAHATDDWHLDDLALDRPHPAGTGLHIVSHWGDVRVRAFPEARLEVVGVAQRHADDPRRASLEVTERDGEVWLTVGYAGAEADIPSPEPDAWRKRRADITIYVGYDTPVELETRHGLGQIKDIRADVRARSESGNLDLVVSGNVEARSKYGAVSVRFGADGWQEPPSIETVTGAIRVELPWTAAFEARLETRGHIRSDYSTTIDWPAGGLLKRGTVRAGSGERSLVVTSQRGDIDLLRTPQLVHPEPQHGEEE